MALKRIGKVGPVVILKGDGEYVCRIPGRRGADYFTSDLADARATAADMRDRLLAASRPSQEARRMRRCVGDLISIRSDLISVRAAAGYLPPDAQYCIAKAIDLLSAAREHASKEARAREEAVHEARKAREIKGY